MWVAGGVNFKNCDYRQEWRRRHAPSQQPAHRGTLRHRVQPRTLAIRLLSLSPEPNLLKGKPVVDLCSKYEPQQVAQDLGGERRKYIHSLSLYIYIMSPGSPEFKLPSQATSKPYCAYCGNLYIRWAWRKRPGQSMESRTVVQLPLEA